MESEEWITSKEGAELLNVPQPNFLYYAKRGEIAVKDPDSLHMDRLYSRSDTIKIRKRLLSKKRTKKQEPPPIITDWLSPDDIPAILQLDKIVYHEMFLAEMERYRQWSEKNGQLAMAAFDARSNRQTMLAYIACLPLDESVILQVMRGEREEVDITPEEMQSYDRPGPYTLLANSAVVHPAHPYLLRRVLQGMIDAWVERYPNQYVTRVYAQSVSERGDALISNFFMQPRYDLHGSEYPAYMLDMVRPGRSRIIREFQEQLKAKAPLPPELQWPPVQTHIQAVPAQQPAQVTTPVRAAVTSLSRSTPTPTIKSDRGTLPEGMENFTHFYRRHRISDATAGRGRIAGKYPATQGRWKDESGHVIQWALDPVQQRDFCNYFKRLSPDAKLVECDDPTCVCHSA